MDQPGNKNPPAPSSVELFVEPPAPVRRRGEPVRCGIPWPRGVLRDASLLRLADEQGRPVRLQARALDCWPDGSVRWVLLDWQADVHGPTRFRLSAAAPGPPPAPAPGRLQASAADGRVAVDTGAARFRLRAGGNFPFEEVTVSGGGGGGGYAVATAFTVEDEAGRVFRPAVAGVRLEEAGPVRAVVHLEGRLAAAGAELLGEFFAYLHFFAGSPTVGIALTLRNSRKAEHPGGLWDLGSRGSVYLRDAAFTATLPPGGGPAAVRCSPERDAPWERFEPPLEVYQDSSGGPNWKSSNHVNRHHVVPNTFRGYRVRSAGAERTGNRATPAVALERDGQSLALTMEYFWQNFPKAVEATGDALTLRLFPRQYADVHELQGGEQKTHQFYVAFGPDPVTDEPLAWGRAPLLPRAEPAWYGSTAAIPYLTRRAEDPNTAYLRLVDAAVEGEDTFAHKREVIDEYGWRHFGDVYGDHEAVYCPGPMPLVSHYNNQYDPVAGFAYQFLRSGDPRWWELMNELAAHVTDIDIYHTDKDKAAYNRGLFWHTYHYTDADTATHRSYPSRGKIYPGPPRAAGQADPGAALSWSPRKGKVSGGGPANEQNYTTGLMLHYFLTGDPLSRQTAIDLARWVIDIDDGRKTVFRRLDRGYTGLASSSGSPLYHGPGRGAGNSVNALLDGHRLTGDPEFLAKADQLIRRCIHPADDVERRELLDAERRWYYTVFLQALGRYLDHKAELGQLDFMYAYARESLLHYARWMADHEHPILDKPEQLEYPNETWAAQDMRKSEVFKYAAKHAAGPERARFLERSDFFFRYVTSTLAGMKTRSLARPVILMLSYGFMHAYFQKYPTASAPPPAAKVSEFGRPEVFIPQKVRAKKRLVALAGSALLLVILLAILGLVYWLKS